MKIVLAGTRAQKRTGKAQSACLPVSCIGEICSLPKYELRRFILGKLGIKGPWCIFAFDDSSYLASNASRCPRCKIFDFLAGQHPRPFNNFKEIGCAPLVLILKTCSSLMMRDYYFCVWSKPINALKISIAANRYCYDFTISPKCNTRIIKINGMRKITQWWKLQIIALQRFERHTCRFGTVAIALQAPAIP